MPLSQRNFARDTFPVGDSGPGLAQTPVQSVDAPRVAAAVVSDLRRATGRYPDSRRLAAVVHDLRSGNPEFAEFWATGSVGAHREEHKRISHPVVGMVELDCDVLTDEAERKIVILTAAPASDDETKLKLTLISGVPTPMSAVEK